jgi:hypothetical protein
MLDVDKAKRATAADCLKHPWLAPTTEELESERRIAEYCKRLATDGGADVD